MRNTLGLSLLVFCGESALSAVPPSCAVPRSLVGSAGTFLKNTRGCKPEGSWSVLISDGYLAHSTAQNTANSPYLVSKVRAGKSTLFFLEKCVDGLCDNTETQKTFITDVLSIDRNGKNFRSPAGCGLKPEDLSMAALALVDGNPGSAAQAVKGLWKVDSATEKLARSPAKNLRCARP